MLIKIYLLYEKKYYAVNVQAIALTVLPFSKRILNLGLKIKTFSKSAFLGQLKYILHFKPKWPATEIRGEDRFCKFFFSHALLLDIVHSISYSSLQQSSSHPNRLSWLKIQSTNDGVVSSRGRRQIIIYCQTSLFSCGLNKNKLIKCFIIR